MQTLSAMTQKTTTAQKALMALTATLLLASAPGAHASGITTYDINGTYTITTSNLKVTDGTNGRGLPNPNGAPSIGDDLGSQKSGTTYNIPTENLPVGSETTATSFITTSPPSETTTPSSHDFTGTVTETLTAAFTLTDPFSSNPVTVDATGTYSANYNGDTDSIMWTGGVLNGSTCTTNNGDGTGPSIDECATIPVDFSDGAVLDVILNDADDWNITSDISFDLVQGPTPSGQQVPEPGSLVLLGTALAGLALVRRRLSRKTV